jgi:hypothetical protein
VFSRILYLARGELCPTSRRFAQLNAMVRSEQYAHAQVQRSTFQGDT